MGPVCATNGTICAPAATADTLPPPPGPGGSSMDLDTTPATAAAAATPPRLATSAATGDNRSRGPAAWASLVELGRARAASHGDEPLYTFYPDRAGAAPAQLSYA